MFSNKNSSLAIAILLIISLLTILSGCNSNKSISSGSNSAYTNANSTNTGSIADIDQNNQNTLNKDVETENSNNTESQIKQALKSSETYVFEIQSDFKFKNANAASTRTEMSKGEYSSSGLPDTVAQGLLIGFIMKNTIRVNSNSVTMDEPEYYCNLSVLSGNDGVRIDISRGNSMSVNQGQLEGIIKGDTLTATAQVSSNTLVNHVGNGMGGVGEFTVSIKRLETDQLPPKTAINVQISRNSDNSILVSWEDPNPKDLIESYDIYRMSGSFLDYNKVATVSNNTSWIDNSEDVKINDIVHNATLFYYIIVRAKNGKESPLSKSASLYGFLFE